MTENGNLEELLNANFMHSSYTIVYIKERCYPPDSDSKVVRKKIDL